MPPAVPVPGCVVNASRLSRPATSVSVPKLVLLAVTAAIVEVPVLVRLPLASGVPALGRTRTFCHVNEQVVPAPLTLDTVKVICVVVREGIAAAVPLVTPLIHAPLPLSRVIKTVGAGVPLESKRKPVGALRIIV